MYELKKNGKVFTSKFVGTGPSSYEKRIYRDTVSQRLRNTAVCRYTVSPDVTEERSDSIFRVKWSRKNGLFWNVDNYLAVDTATFEVCSDCRILSNLIVTMHPFFSDFLHWRTRRTHRSTTHCRACGHTAHALRPRSSQFLMGLRVECFKMEEQLLLLEKPFVESIFIKWREKLLGEPNFRRKREVWRVSYFVPNAAGSSTNLFFSVF